jgi:hypothetical protein
MRAPPVSDSGRGRVGRLRLGPEGQLGRECDAGMQGGAGERLVGCAGELQREPTKRLLGWLSWAAATAAASSWAKKGRVDRIGFRN